MRMHACRARPHRRCCRAAPPPLTHSAAWRAALHALRGSRLAPQHGAQGCGRERRGAHAPLRSITSAEGRTTNADYTATASDSRVLQRPLREELRPREITNVFDHPRNLRERCAAPMWTGIVSRRTSGDATPATVAFGSGAYSAVACAGR